MFQVVVVGKNWCCLTGGFQSRIWSGLEVQAGLCMCAAWCCWAMNGCRCMDGGGVRWCWLISWKQQKKYFDQLSGACSTWKLVKMNARPDNSQLIPYYLCVRYLSRIQQYPVNTTYNINFSDFSSSVVFSDPLLGAAWHTLNILSRYLGVWAMIRRYS